MAKVMLTIRADRAPTLEEVRRKYGLGPEDVDAEFGVIPVDPERHAYTILIDADSASRVFSDDRWTIEGPFANPRIAPFDSA
jgi:hypothetical protein